ncbi:unnamed protein product [Didymodactylos carnosus]|uniref:PHD-type domain-containing protein n=1 Tax=Didymodactylos carnosus TaxID=1234261 RepID=A0A8S2D0A7_9BILA|nr:unnamed protein product [Didymodactylos carnosus]CAF3597587.1 unnamed protein product [Didymodactylos carnosus]
MNEKLAIESGSSTNEQSNIPNSSSVEQLNTFTLPVNDQLNSPSTLFSTNQSNASSAVVIQTDEKPNESQMNDKTKKEERYLYLLNDSNYGVILCFLDKFRPLLDLHDYPLRLLEEHLLSDDENISRQLMDFHISLLKRLVFGKNAKHENFLSTITRFTYRFDLEDGDHLTSVGYAHAEINVKIRILKNLLEAQFDQNQTLKAAIQDKPSNEIRSQPLGRDQYGSSYWLFMDRECFVHLFRESSDYERTWSNVAKNEEEFERFTKCLTYDQTLKKKFHEWKLEIPTFFLPDLPIEHFYDSKLYFNDTKETTSQSEENEKQTKFHDNILSPKNEIAQENINTATTSNSESVKHEIKQEEVKPIEENCNIEKSSNEADECQIQTNEVGVIKNRSRRKAVSWTRKKKDKKNIAVDIDTQSQSEKEKKSTTLNGRKRKRIDDEYSDINGGEENSNSSMSKTNLNETLLDDDRVSYLLMRFSKKNIDSLLLSDDHDTLVKSSKKIDNKIKNQIGPATRQQQTLSCPNLLTKTKRTRKKKRVKNNCGSYWSETSSDDEKIISDEDDDDVEEESDHFENEMEVEDNLDDDDEYVPLAKTVLSKRRKAAETDGAVDWTLLSEHTPNTTACCSCLKTDHPELLLLCDNCDDAYHTDCLKPILLNIPDGNWYCPLCEHKHLCEILVEKLKQLIENHKELELKRNQCIIEENNDRLSNSTENVDYKDDNSQQKNDVNEDEPGEDEHDYEISQRGRKRRSRFKIKIQNSDDEENYDDDSRDTDYDLNESRGERSNNIQFDLKLPNSIKKLLNNRCRTTTTTTAMLNKKDRRDSTRMATRSIDINDVNHLNEKLGSPLVYVNMIGGSSELQSVITNSKQTSQIVRRWRDVQRRSSMLKSKMPTTSDCADDGDSLLDSPISVCGGDQIRSPINSSYDDDNNSTETIIRSKTSKGKRVPTSTTTISKHLPQYYSNKSDTNFEKLTHDIQQALSVTLSKKENPQSKNITVSSTNINTEGTSSSRITLSSSSFYSSKPTSSTKLHDSINLSSDSFGRLGNNTSHHQRVQTSFLPYREKLNIIPTSRLMSHSNYKIFKSKDPPTTTNGHHSSSSTSSSITFDDKTLT